MCVQCRKDAGGARHGGERANQLAPAALFECQNRRDADNRESGYDAEPFQDRAGARQKVGLRQVHVFLQVKGEHRPPDDPDT